MAIPSRNQNFIPPINVWRIQTRSSTIQNDQTCRLDARRQAYTTRKNNRLSEGKRKSAMNDFAPSSRPFLNKEHKRTRAIPDGIKKKEREYHQRLVVADIKPSSTNRLRKGKHTQKEKISRTTGLRVRCNQRGYQKIITPRKNREAPKHQNNRPSHEP